MFLLIKETIGEAFFGIWLLLDGAIYSFIASSYRIFMAVAEARILSSDAYTKIANNVYTVIGVVMLFVLAYAILKAIIDPDQVTKGKLSAPNILKKIVIAVLGLALTPVFFNLMYQAQTLFLEQDVLVKLFFRSDKECISTGSVSGEEGKNVNWSSSEDEDVKANNEICWEKQVKRVGGSLTAASVWQAFFYPNGLDAEEITADPEEVYAQANGMWVGTAVLGIAGSAALVAAAVGAANIWNPVGWVCLIGAAVLGVAAAIKSDAANTISQYTDEPISLADAYAVASGTGNFHIFSAFVPNVQNSEITYLWLISTIAGAFVLYVFVSFSIDMGFRAAKLAYYQIIAPIPMILSVLPEFEANFNNYIKSVISTFVEVFIRISVVYICVYIISNLTSFFSSTNQLWGTQDLHTVETLLALAALILGLVAFAKEAPNLIGEVFGMKSGSMKLGIKEKLAKGGLFTAGSIVGSQIAGASNSIASAVRSERWKERRGFAQKAATVLGAGARGFGRGSYDSVQTRLTERKPVESFREMVDKSKRAGEHSGDRETALEHGTKARHDARQEVRDARTALDDARNLPDTDPNKAEKVASAEDRLNAARRNERSVDYQTLPTHRPLDAARRYFVGTADTKADEELSSSYAVGEKITDSARSAVKNKVNAETRTMESYEKQAQDTKLEDVAKTVTDDDRVAYQRKKNADSGYVIDSTKKEAFLRRTGLLRDGETYDDSLFDGLEDQYLLDQYRSESKGEAEQKKFSDRVRELDGLRKTAKDVLESVSDLTWSQNLTKGGNDGANAQRAANDVLGQSYLWKQNGSETVKHEVKVLRADGTLGEEPISEKTLGEFVRSYLGEDALNGNFNASQMSSRLRGHDTIFVSEDGTHYSQIVYSQESVIDPSTGLPRENCYVQKAADGTVIRTFADTAEVSAEIQNPKYKKVENQSAAKIVADTFKKARATLDLSISERRQRQRQASGGGGGGKRGK